MPFKASIVLCEGTSDEAFVKALIRARGIQHVDVIERRKDPKFKPPGVGGFQQRLEALKFEPGIEKRKAIVLLADNDLDANNLFTSIVGLINAAGEYNAPPRVWEGSNRGKYPPIHIVNLPTRTDPGCVEMLWLQSAEPKAPAIKLCIDRLIVCLGLVGWSPGNVAKLKLRCLVAATLQKNPTLKIEDVWYDRDQQRDIIPLDHQCFNPLANYLGGL